MTGIEVLLTIGGAAALLVLAFLLYRLVASRTTPPARAAWTPPPAEGIGELRRVGDEVVARLAVAIADPDRPSAQRLAHELAEQALATFDDVDQVLVEDVAGRHVVTVPRRPGPLDPTPTRPERAHAEGHPAGRHRRREPLGAIPRVADGADLDVPSRPLAERLQLPEVVRAEVRQPDDAVDVVRAILVAGGHEVRVTGTTLLVGDTAVVVVPEDDEWTDALGHAYLRFQRSGAQEGIIVHTGYVDPAELRRRDAVVKHLRYAGREAIPRMAAAVDLGVDPLAAARGVTARR